MKWRLALVGFLLLGQVANILAIIRMLGAIISGSDQAKVIALAYDQLGNTAFNGHEDELISSRAGRALQRGRKWACYLCKMLDWFDTNHCVKSIERWTIYRDKRRLQHEMERALEQAHQP